MATYTSANLIVEFDNAAGSLVNMSTYVLTLNGVKTNVDLEETHSFGDSWVERTGKGTKRIDDITLSGIYDDTITTGPEVIFNDVGNVGTTAGAPRTLKITWGGTKTTSFETYIKSFKKNPTREEMTKFEVVLSPTGTVTEV